MPEQNAKKVVVGKKEKAWRNAFIVAVIIAIIGLGILGMFAIQPIAYFLTVNGGLLLIFFMLVLTLGMAWLLFSKKKKANNNIETIVSLIREEEWKNNGIILNTKEYSVTELGDGRLLIGFDEVDLNDDEPPRAYCYIYNTINGFFYQFMLGTKEDALNRIQESKLLEKFGKSSQAEAENQMLKEKFGVDIEQITE